MNNEGILVAPMNRAQGYLAVPGRIGGHFSEIRFGPSSKTIETCARDRLEEIERKRAELNAEADKAWGRYVSLEENRALAGLVGSVGERLQVAANAFHARASKNESAECKDGVCFPVQKRSHELEEFSHFAYALANFDAVHRTDAVRAMADAAKHIVGVVSLSFDDAQLIGLK